jgi:hypothetical protein
MVAQGTFSIYPVLACAAVGLVFLGAPRLYKNRKRGHPEYFAMG